MTDLAERLRLEAKYQGGYQADLMLMAAEELEKHERGNPIDEIVRKMDLVITLLRRNGS